MEGDFILLLTVKTWLLVHWSTAQLYLGADVGRSTANTIRSVANDLRWAALMGLGASIMWAAAEYGIGGEEAGRNGKRRFNKSLIGIVGCAAAWFVLTWMKDFGFQNFPG